jgi:uncharacterized integral membrane protein
LIRIDGEYRAWVLFAHLKKGTMNFKLLFKSILILAVLALLVIMGVNNPQPVTLEMKPIPSTLKQPAGYMYFGFFGVGFVVGALMMAGGGGGKKSSSSKPPKEK